MTKNLRITTLALASGMVLGWTGHLMAADNASAAMNAYMESMQKMDSQMKQSMDKMHAGASKATADHHFVTMMIPHHMGAVDMAKIELKYGSDPMLRKMAQKIVSSQTKEIQELKAWQTKHPMP